MYIPISPIEQKKGALDTIKLRYDVFIDLRKAFGAVNHEILIFNVLVCLVYLCPGFASIRRTDRHQFLSVSNSKSDLLKTKYGVSQGSILGPLLFLIYVNDKHKALTFSKTHHFVDDKNFLYVAFSLKDINWKINYDMSRLT